MPQDSSIWFRLGYAAERALARVTPGGGEADGGESEARKGKTSLPMPRRPGRSLTPDALDRVLAAGLGAVATRILQRWSDDKGPGLMGLVRAGAAGATAALVVELARPLLTDQELDLGQDLVGELLTGAGSGLIYASLVEPRVPGPLFLRGALYGTVDYLASGWGGLGEVLRPLTPQHRIPVVGDVLTGGMAEGRSYLEHLAFAVALAELYGEG